VEDADDEVLGQVSFQPTELHLNFAVLVISKQVRERW
jgi:hypothetical protein